MTRLTSPPGPMATVQDSGYPYLHPPHLNPACDRNCDEPHCRCGGTFGSPIHYVEWSPLPSSPVVIGHRGTGRGPFENTREDFHAAANLGAEWVELDVVATSEGDLVLTHDLFCGGEPVWKSSARDLRAEIFDTGSVPAGTGIAIELKLTPDDLEGRGTLSALLRILASLAEAHPIMVCSFDPMVVAELVRLHIPACWITKQGLPPIEAAITASAQGASAVMVHGPSFKFDDPGWIHAREILGEDIGLWVWDAEPGDVALHLSHGVTGLCGDDIPGLIAARARATGA